MKFTPIPYSIVVLIAVISLSVGRGADVLTQPAPASGEVDPLVKASAYGDKSVWSYSSDKPVPWTKFHPHDYGSSKIEFSGEGVTPVGHVPAPGVHPRLFFSPEDLPAIRKRLKEDRGAHEAWLNLLAYTNTLKLTYDEKADYALPDWSGGCFGIHGRFCNLAFFGGYNPKREDYYSLLADGKMPEKTYAKDPPANFFRLAAVEAFRCLIDKDETAGKRLASAVITAIKLEQARRAKEDKPAEPGQPPRPSTPRSDCCDLGLTYDFLFNYMAPDQQKIVHDELVLLSSWADNYGTFNNAEASRSNWATFTYWVWDVMAIQGEPGFNDLKFLGLYRGWRNFYSYSFFDSGAAFEGEGKLLFGIDAIVAFDRVAPLYGLPLLTQHPLVRSHYAKFTALSVLPTQDKFAKMDMLGGMGGGLTTPQDLVVAHYLYPKDATIDFVYHTLVGDDYKNLPSAIYMAWNTCLTSAIFATSFNPENTPEKLKLPLTFFCGQRALMMTRSSWDKNATMLTMHVRGASGGHPYRDRNSIMMAAEGRTWITIPGKDVGGWACNTVRIDDSDQNSSTPGRLVDFSDQPSATFAAGDAKYCWDWIWSFANKNLEGQRCSLEDVTYNKAAYGLGWQPVEQSFNDFAYTQSDREIYKRPLKIMADWLAVDGVYDARIRQVNLPVLKAFRTAGLVRGKRPYVLVVDDDQRDALPCKYSWNITLADDVVQVKTPGELGNEGDVILAGNKSVQADGTIKAGEPVLLARLLDFRGKPEISLAVRNKTNVLTINTVAPSPNFKVLLYPFRKGDPLPETEWDPPHQAVTLNLPDQKDVLAFRMSDSGKTNLEISRSGQPLIVLNKPVTPLADSEIPVLDAWLEKIPTRLEAILHKAFEPTELPGFVAGYNFDRMENGAYPPMPGSVPTAKALPGEETTPVTGMHGRKAALMSAKGLSAPMDFAEKMPGPVTISLWFKSKEDPFCGFILGCDGIFSACVIQGGTWIGALNKNPIANLSSSMFSNWTQFTITKDETNFSFYRNGLLIFTAPNNTKQKPGRNLKIGGYCYGDVECTVQNLLFYNVALTREQVEDLYIYGKYVGKD